jgi:hypothetical protein
VRRTFSRPEDARALLDAVRADTPEFVRLSVEGRSLEIRLTARSAASARATCEDLFACLKVAERTILTARPPEAGSPAKRAARSP